MFRDDGLYSGALEVAQLRAMVSHDLRGVMDDRAQGREDTQGRPRESSIWSAIRIYLTFCTPAEKRRLVGAIGFSFFIALIQAVSVASVMPFLALVSDPGLIQSNPWATAVYEWGGFRSASQFVVFTGVASIIVISGANLLTALGMRSVMIFVWDQHSRVTVDLFSRYLGLPYLEFRNRHSADLTQKLMNESGSLSEGVAMQIVTLVSEGLSGLVIFTLPGASAPYAVPCNVESCDRARRTRPAG